MARRTVLVASVYVCAFACVTGAGALLAPPAATPQLPSPDTFADDPGLHVRGKGAATGHVTDLSLHAAHVRGAQPIACVKCHAISEHGFAKPDRARCLACHPERTQMLHSAVDDANARECTACHDFLDSRPTAQIAWTCARCHPRPHGDPLLYAGDASQSCGRCHGPHGDRAASAPTCTGCHEDHANRHKAAGDPASGDCLACHGRHDPAANARLRCQPCHTDGKDPKTPRIPATATWGGGHQCANCHAPHKFAKDEVRACQTCHADHPVALAAAKVPEHARCISCHNPHDVKTADQRCASCHTNVHPTHPAKLGCIGCHAPHPSVVTEGVPVAQCTSCHPKGHDDHGAHRGARCTDCHQAHDFKLTLTPPLCLGCHARRVGAKPAVSPNSGHAECTKCHLNDPHAPAAPPACSTCHGEQASTVPAGHANCEKCHQMHDGALRPGVTACVGCHTDRKRGPHVAISGGCERCHRPHAGKAGGADATPPTCTTCHDRSALPGMHTVAGHATCTKCHQPHGATFPDRETCLSCHADHRDHQPQATTCYGCHTFRHDPTQPAPIPVLPPMPSPPDGGVP